MQRDFFDPLRGAAVALLLLSACSIPIDTGLGGAKRSESAAESEAVTESLEAGRRAYETGNADDAAELLEQAEDAAATDPDKGQTADTLANLAMEQSRRGNNQEALQLHERALRLREEAYGKSSPQVAESLNFLGAAYYQAQRYDDAEDAFERAVAIRKKTLGADNRLTGLSMNNLAFFYAARGNYEKAEPLFVESIAIIDKAPDATWAEKSQALDNYAAMLHDAGRGEDAAAIEKQSATYRSKRRQIQDIMERTREKQE